MSKKMLFRCKTKKKNIFRSIYLCIWIFFVILPRNLLCIRAQENNIKSKQIWK